MTTKLVSNRQTIANVYSLIYHCLAPVLSAHRGECLAMQAYSEKLVTPPKVLPDMELVEQQVDKHASCTCERASTTSVTNDPLS